MWRDIRPETLFDCEPGALTSPSGKLAYGRPLHNKTASRLAGSEHLHLTRTPPQSPASATCEVATRRWGHGNPHCGHPRTAKRTRPTAGVEEVLYFMR
ncbi:hypothetical protein EVAR_74604_1 [Eumeta japonica]|uniref:Uncharacterized protein n=1 Tax=Eumeta variegata TaxID=151549 RepID=A0A4C1WC97_EUMVA|nr:hypothetical protein EVAR_74604_1 [Eumeta japonica]